MTQNEIIEMAKEAGFWQDLSVYEGLGEHFKAFAKLVAAKEREACAKRASVALLGTLKTTSDRVLAAIRARGEA
jgi:hypothetical protein